MRLSSSPVSPNVQTKPGFGYAAMYPSYGYGPAMPYPAQSSYPQIYYPQPYWQTGWPQSPPTSRIPSWNSSGPFESAHSQIEHNHADNTPPGLPNLQERSSQVWKPLTDGEPQPSGTASKTSDIKTKTHSSDVTPATTTNDPDKAQFLELAGQLYDQPEVRRLLTPEAVKKLKTAIQNPLQLRQDIIGILGQTPKGQEVLSRFKTALGASPMATKLMEKTLNWVVPTQYKDLVQGFFSQIRSPSAAIAP